MKRLLLLGVALLMTTSVARADHFTIQRSAGDPSCSIPAPGFYPYAVVVHQFTLGATGSRLKVTFPAGSLLFAFDTPYVPIGNLATDLSLGYGQCLTGSIILGTIIASYGPGTLGVVPADTFSSIIYTDCNFDELPATGGRAYVGGVGDCDPLAVESSTWGKVKSLYR